MTDETTPSQTPRIQDQSQDQGQGRGLAVASLVLGITSFFPGCFLLHLHLNYILALLAVTFGANGRKGPGRGMATAGMILGIVNMAVPLALLAGGIGLAEMIEKWSGEQKVTVNDQDVDIHTDDTEVKVDDGDVTVRTKRTVEGEDDQRSEPNDARTSTGSEDGATTTGGRSKD